MRASGASETGFCDRVTMRAAHVVVGRDAYVLASFAPDAEFVKIDRAIADSIETFRELTQREAADIRPTRLDFYTVRGGDTWQSIAPRTCGWVRATDLAIMNHHEVSDQPDPGERIKIVVIG